MCFELDTAEKYDVLEGSFRSRKRRSLLLSRSRLVLEEKLKAIRDKRKKRWEDETRELSVCKLEENRSDTSSTQNEHHKYSLKRKGKKQADKDF